MAGAPPFMPGAPGLPPVGPPVATVPPMGMPVGRPPLAPFPGAPGYGVANPAFPHNPSLQYMEHMVKQQEEENAKLANELDSLKKIDVDTDPTSDIEVLK